MEPWGSEEHSLRNSDLDNMTDKKKRLIHILP